MKNKPLKHMISVATLAILMQTTPVFASPVIQGQINSTQGQMNTTELEIENLNTQIQQIDNDIVTAIDKSQKLNVEIKMKQRKIEETKVKIEKSQKIFDIHKNVYSERLRSIQIQGQSSVLTYAEILFSSKSLSDLINRATAVSTILQSDLDLMDVLKEKEQELADAKVKLDNQLRDLTDNQNQLASEQISIEAKKLEIQQRLTDSKNVLRRQQAELSKQQAQLTQPSMMDFNATNVQASFFDDSNVTYSSDKANQVIVVAKKYRGVPYVWGGSKPSGFDCSGFTYYVFKNTVGIKLPRVSRDQQNVGTRISTNQVQPGDLVFKGYPAYHVGIYIGEGKYIHAPQTGDVVKIASYNPSSFSTASRILN